MVVAGEEEVEKAEHSGGAPLLPDGDGQRRLMSSSITWSRVDRFSFPLRSMKAEEPVA